MPGVLGFALGSLLPLVSARGSWRQDAFSLGAWIDPPPTDDHYALYRGANLTVLQSLYQRNVSVSLAQAALCHKHGLKCILSGDGTQAHGSMTDPTCKGSVDPASLPPASGLPASSTWGFYLWDEPYQHKQDEPHWDMYGWLKQTQDAVHAQRPDSLVLINAGDGQPTESAAFYEEYVTAVEPDVLSIDFYPSFGGQVLNHTVLDTRVMYLQYLEGARRTALAHQLPLWTIFAGAAGGSLTPYGVPALNGTIIDVTEAQVKFQAWVALAFGSRGL